MYMKPYIELSESEYTDAVMKAQKGFSMKKIKIVGENYIGKWEKARTACRGIVTDGGRILLVCEPGIEEYMIPGGGLEKGESDNECCVREIAEETGVLVEPSDCLLEIDEYYGNDKFVNKYFLCRPVGTTEMHLTEAEQKLGMEPRWLSISEAQSIFSNYQSYAESNEERCGLYLREHQVLIHIF